MALKTMYYFKNFVIMENFLSISRPYLIEDQRTKLICNCISFTVITTIAIILILDFITTSSNVGIRLFEIIIAFEFFGMASMSRYRKAIFTIIERLDEKCGVDEVIGLKIRAETTKVLIPFLPSLILDFFGLKLLGATDYISIFLCVAFAAHDAEMIFFSMLVETINMRLEKLKSATPNTGCRVYRHVLIAIAHLNEQYTPRLLLLLVVTLITTVAYEFILTLADSNKTNLVFYLIWRESRSMFSLWMMCKAVARTSSVCSGLSLHLAGRLTQDQSISKENNPVQYKTLQRWHSMVMRQKPRYISGSILSIGLSTPLIVLDLSINYMLIIVQQYLAYK